VKVLLNSFHLNGHTLGFYSQGHLLQLISPRQLVTLLCCSLSSHNQDDGDGDSDIESKDLDLPLRDPVHLRTDKKFDDAYISQKELGKYVSLFFSGLLFIFSHMSEISVRIRKRFFGLKKI